MSRGLELDAILARYEEVPALVAEIRRMRAYTRQAVRDDGEQRGRGQ